MRYNIKNTLSSIVLATGIVGLVGCAPYAIGPDGIDKLGEKASTEWVRETDNYMEVNVLLKEGQYDLARSKLEGYLKESRDNSLVTKGLLTTTDKFSASTKEKIMKTIDDQSKKIEDHLK